MAAGFACAIAVAGLGTGHDRGYMFGDEFRRCIEDDLIKREPRPGTKPLGAFSLDQLE